MCTFWEQNVEVYIYPWTYSITSTKRYSFQIIKKAEKKIRNWFIAGKHRPIISSKPCSYYLLLDHEYSGCSDTETFTNFFKEERVLFLMTVSNFKFAKLVLRDNFVALFWLLEFLTRHRYTCVHVVLNIKRSLHYSKPHNQAENQQILTVNSLNFIPLNTTDCNVFIKLLCFFILPQFFSGR